MEASQEIYEYEFNAPAHHFFTLPDGREVFGGARIGLTDEQASADSRFERVGEGQPAEAPAQQPVQDSPDVDEVQSETS